MAGKRSSDAGRTFRAGLDLEETGGEVEAGRPRAAF